MLAVYDGGLYTSATNVPRDYFVAFLLTFKVCLGADFAHLEPLRGPTRSQSSKTDRAHQVELAVQRAGFGLPPGRRLTESEAKA